jgi:hypothetical protein
MGNKFKLYELKSDGRSIFKTTKLLRLKSKLLYHLANQLTSVSSFSEISVLKD